MYILMEILKVILLLLLGLGVTFLLMCPVIFGGEETPPDEPDYWKKIHGDDC